MATLKHEFSHALDFYNGTFAANYKYFGYDYALNASEYRAYGISSNYYYSIGNSNMGMLDSWSMTGYKSLMIMNQIDLNSYILSKPLMSR